MVEPKELQSGGVQDALVKGGKVHSTSPGGKSQGCLGAWRRARITASAVLTIEPDG